MRMALLAWVTLFRAFAEATTVEAPSAPELEKVIRYYYGGKEQGPVLAALKACLRVDLDPASPTRNECLGEVVGPVPRGTQLYAWSLWMVPDGGQYDDVTLQFVHEGMVRSSIAINLNASLRSRAFRPSVLSQPGRWEVRVARKDKVLAKVELKVK